MDVKHVRVVDPYALSRKTLHLKFYPLILTILVLCIGTSSILGSTVYQLHKSPPEARPPLNLTFNLSTNSELKYVVREVPQICVGCKLVAEEEGGIKMQVFGFPFCILSVLLLNVCSIVDHARKISTYQKSCLRCSDPWLMMFCCFFMILACFCMFHPVLNRCSNFGSSFSFDSDEWFWYEADREACNGRWNVADSMAALFIGIFNMILYVAVSMVVCKVPRLKKEEGEGPELQSQEQQGVTYYYDFTQ